MLRPPDHLIVCETAHWLINHRVDAALPGYFMVGSRVETNQLSDLCPEAQAELGRHLAKLQQVLTELLAPSHFYIGRYGHMKGHSIHFHVIPICDWVVQAFLRDERYRVLHQFYDPDFDASGSNAPFDGAEMTLYVWREFCESKKPPEIAGPSIAEVVRLVRGRFRS